MAKTRLVSVLLRILKIFGIVLLVIFVLFGSITWIVFEKKNDWLVEQVQSYLNESQSGELVMAGIDLKLFRSFPDVSIELDSIYYYQHRDSLRDPMEQPILRAKQLLIAIELLPLMRDELIVSEISLVNAQLNVVELEKGVLNIELALANPSKSKVVAKKIVPKPLPKKPPAKKRTTPVPKPTPSGIQVDLQSVLLSDVQVTWKSFSNRKPSVVRVKRAEADLLKEGNVLTAKLASSYHITSLFIDGVSLPKGDVSFSTSLRYQIDRQELMIRQSKLAFNIFSASVQGTYSHQKGRKLDIQIDASSNDLELLSAILKPDVVKRNPDMLKRGDIYAKGRIFGELKKHPPQVEISFGLSDLDIELPRSSGAFRNIGFKGSFSTGALPDYSEAKFEVNNLKAELPGGFVKGQFSVNNFLDPYLKYDLDARFQLEGYDEIFNIDFLKEMSGAVSLQANFDGLLNLKDKHQTDSIRSSSISLNNLAFVVAKTNQRVSGLSGKIETRYNQTNVKQLAFTYGKNDLVIDASVDNLLYLLFKRDSVSASGHVQSNVLFTRDFIPDTLLTAEVQDEIHGLAFDFQIHTSANKLYYKASTPNINFDISNLSARLVKLPDIKKLDTKGQFSQTANGHKLDLQEFHATMPYGNVEVVGDLLIPEKKIMQFNARVKMNKFPWTYVMELAKEIQVGVEPVAKNFQEKEMELVTADLDLSAAIITYPFDITNVQLRNSKVQFFMPDSKPVSVENINLDLKNLYFIHPKNSGNITGLKSTSGQVEMKQLRVPGLNPINISLDITGQDDQLNVKFTSAIQKSKKEEGHLLLDMTKNPLAYQLHYAVEKASLTHFVEKYYKKKFMEGDINYVMDISSAGSTWALIKQNLTGTVEIQGDSLTFYGADIDNVLRKYEKSQKFNLTDLGAVIIAGPVGLAVTKGTDFVSLAAVNLNSSQQTKIKTLLARWKLEDRQLITKDVAFATYKNRIAFDGRIDFAHDTIPGFTIAVVDKEGCSLMDQKLYGKMGTLKTGKINVAKTLFGSVINFVNAVVGKDCKIFYTGEVEAPLN